ncbi:8-amino-7-oxononanoate synthase [Psychrobium sp. 1_MG-2023]|uniref:8-amino-7-oxononanoate synthase n=1 Tax=Psychrobium sp. 1_MG-2023 TaxID=3062624 RepID=UPI000C325412|nr:8-amino-7-oxononanoate synthase [Psychrobium sp. 1_MG-2023]MDP2562489.1 8-amino-7-oxononanoate synthase [Psychrobium sp. 1_MG-2023]PKF54323.1 8-amino-7-oxononanoate synthase [Alteromonadales bacterium alter-6D02]
MSFKHLAEQITAQHQKQGYRQTRTVDGGNHVSLFHHGQHYINFSGNDYLGLACDPDVLQAASDAIVANGVGSGGSPLVTGHSSFHQRLEEQICTLTNQDSAILFSSGFAANSGVISSLLNKGDLLVQDKLNHASLMDAGMQSAATMKRFKHNDMLHLERTLANSNNFENTLVVSEGVFSMDGDQGDLKAIATQAKKHNAWLMVDDAHGFGINGAKHGQGAGTCLQQGIKPDILMATFGKAIGTSGAFIAANQEVVEFLTNFCRHYIYSTALPIPVVAATIKSIELAQQSWRHDQLLHNIHVFRQRAQLLSLNLSPSNSAIQPIIIGDSAATLAIAEQLKQQGFWVTAIRPPTVPVGTARLRMTLSANHQAVDIESLLEALATILASNEYHKENDSCL